MGWLFDTDILIDYLRAHHGAIKYLESRIAEAYISVMSVAELYQGAREGNERSDLQAMLSAMTILPISVEIAERGGLLSRDYRPTHGVGLADALIAATAEVYSLKLVTLNKKHFPMIPAVTVPYQK